MKGNIRFVIVWAYILITWLTLPYTRVVVTFSRAKPSRDDCQFSLSFGRIWDLYVLFNKLKIRDF